MEAANRRHLANMRVVQKNLVYIIGLHPKLATEEVKYQQIFSLFFIWVTDGAFVDNQIKRLFWTVWENCKDCNQQETNCAYLAC